jgi:hypothetical protein
MVATKNLKPLLALFYCRSFCKKINKSNKWWGKGRREADLGKGRREADLLLVETKAACAGLRSQWRAAVSLHEWDTALQLKMFENQNTAG